MCILLSILLPMMLIIACNICIKTGPWYHAWTWSHRSARGAISAGGRCHHSYSRICPSNTILIGRHWEGTVIGQGQICLNSDNLVIRIQTYLALAYDTFILVAEREYSPIWSEYGNTETFSLVLRKQRQGFARKWGRFRHINHYLWSIWTHCTGLNIYLCSFILYLWSVKRNFWFIILCI